MKKLVFPVLLLLLAVFVMPTYADAIAKEVEVVNAPDNPVPVTM